MQLRGQVVYRSQYCIDNKTYIQFHGFKRNSVIEVPECPHSCESKLYITDRQPIKVPFRGSYVQYYCVPEHIGKDPLQSYMQELRRGTLFSSYYYSENYVFDSGISLNKKSLIVIAKDLKASQRYWHIYRIRYRNGNYYHKHIEAIPEAWRAWAMYEVIRDNDW